MTAPTPAGQERADRSEAARDHTADCYAYGCTTGSHRAPRPGHPPTGGPYAPNEVLRGETR